MVVQMLTQQQLPYTDLCLSSLCAGAGGYGTVIRNEALDRFYAEYRKAGGNFFDTAHCYGFWADDGSGASERALGALVRRFDQPRNVVIATKGGHPAVEPDYPRPDAYLAPEVITQDIEDSLSRLGLPHIDLFYLHRDDARVPVGEIIDTLNAEISAGRLRYLGASNWSVTRIAEANAYAKAHGLHGFVASQPQWNLAQTNMVPTADPTLRTVTNDDLCWYRTQRLPIIPYSSTACGYFATDGQAGAASFDNPVSRARLQRAQQLAAELGCTPNQIALAWLLHQDVPVIPILGTTRPEHLQDAISATTICLTPAQRDWLTA